MKAALNLPPGSDIARKYGCSCKDENTIDINCEIHYILFYTRKLIDIHNYIGIVSKNHKYCQVLVMILLIADILIQIWG
jgi:hypothetical protein